MWRGSLFYFIAALAMMLGSCGGNFTNSVGIEFALIPSGTFIMGSSESEIARDDDELQHRVNLTRSYYISTKEITQSQWREVTGENPSNHICNDCPVEGVNWYECIEFCNLLSKSEGYEPVYTVDGQSVTWEKKKRGYRLPTEAEWEYACRAGTRTPTYNGADEQDILNIGWCRENSDGETHPVGRKLPNEWGLYDMCGNVWEWCWDRYTEFRRDTRDDPTIGWPTYSRNPPTERVLRGGSYRYPLHCFRSAKRYSYSPILPRNHFGLRVVLDE